MKSPNCSSSVLLFLLFGLAAAVEWLDLPDAKASTDVISKKYFGARSYFCQDSELAPEGFYYSGVVHGLGRKKKRRRRSERECHVVVGTRVLTSKNFQVLALSSNETQVSYTYPPRNNLPPANAVPCSDAEIPVGRCYLGASVYGDGICEEGIGKIDTEARIIYMPIQGRRQRCPFYRYLTVT